MLTLLLVGCVTKEDELASLDRDGDGWYHPSAGDLGEGGPFDCDDDDPDIHPDAPETCDGLDQDCDGAVDDDPATGTTFWSDSDGDGFGDNQGPVVACETSAGVVEVSGDCDDGDADVKPGADELCNSRDDDCNGTEDDSPIDELTWYLDGDGDGFGYGSEIQACLPPDGYVDNDADCDDGNDAIYPGADEHCNGYDEDCDEIIDEGSVDAPVWYLDADKDNFGGSFSIAQCTSPTGYVVTSSDCDDTSSSIHPAATEVCEDGADNDCSGFDETCGIHGAFDLAEASASLTGETIGDAAGFALTSGNFNADGYDDIVVSATTAFDLGAVYVLDGRADLILNEVSLSASDAKIVGAYTGGTTGFSLSTGDFDSDGYDDLISGGGPSGGSGEATVLYGRPSGFSSIATMASADAAFVGEVIDDGAGFSVSGRGDFNGDGYADLLIGAVGSDAGGTDSGAAYLIYGGVSRWSSARDLAAADVRFVGEAPSDRAGWNVAHAGDADGDGDGELLINARVEASVGASGGAVYLFLGDTTPVTGDISAADADAKYIAAEARDFVGGSLAAAGDVDADGYDDYLIGAAGDADEGAAYLVWGRASLILGTRTLQTFGFSTRLRGEGLDDEAGSSVAGAGDVDADGYDDVLIGAPKADGIGSNNGAAYLILGDGALASTIYLSSADAIMTGASSEQAGATVSGAGDINGDGSSDFLIGAYPIETTYLLYGAD